MPPPPKKIGLTVKSDFHVGILAFPTARVVPGTRRDMIKNDEYTE